MSERFSGLVLCRYDALAASTRQRFVQMQPYLEAQGIDIDISPLLDQAYMKATLEQKGSVKMHPIVASYVKRLSALLMQRSFDFLWVQYEVFPYLPSVFERMAYFSGKPVVYDLDDAIFHRYDQHANRMIRQVLGQKLRPLLQSADLALCGNRYLKEYVARDCQHTKIVPTTVDVQRYVVAEKENKKPSTVIGWIGSPSTWEYVEPLVPVLSRLVEQEAVEVKMVGAGARDLPGAGFVQRDWAEQDEVPQIQSMDMGVMPLRDDPWARGKCGYKLIQYMACGLPVVASPVGVNTEIVEHGVNGFLASTDDEWREALQTLIRSPELRAEMGRAGRAKVERHYSLQVHGPKVAEWIKALCVSSSGA